MDRIKPKRGLLTKSIDQLFKFMVTVTFALWLFIPGLLGFFDGEVNTADVMYESFIFATDQIAGVVGSLISMARMLVALSVPAALYRNDVSDLLGLEFIGPRTLGRLLFMSGAIVYAVSAFVNWLHITGGL